MTVIVAGAPVDGSRLWVQWTLSDRGRPTFVSFAGELDGANGDVLVDTLGAVLEACSDRLIIDLTSVAFADAAGAGALLRARRLAGSRAIRLDIVCADRIPRRVLTLADEDEDVEFYATLSEALSAQRSSPSGA
jgi:anti-anti-sigma factor